MLGGLREARLSVVPAIDESEWPIVRITYGETIGLNEIGEFARRLDAIFARRGPMVTVADISALSVSATTALHRKRVAEESDKLADKGAFLGEAVIIRNPVVRVLYLGYTWLKTRSDYPSQTFKDWSAAREWARLVVRADQIAAKR
jgi:hypothetical protein